MTNILHGLGVIRPLHGSTIRVLEDIDRSLYGISIEIVAPFTPVEMQGCTWIVRMSGATHGFGSLCH